MDGKSFAIARFLVVKTCEIGKKTIVTNTNKISEKKLMGK